MDIKAKIEQIVAKVKGDPKLMESFKKDPVKTIESLAGVDIPDGAEDKIVSGVKAALTGDKLSGAVEAVKKLL
ncbi:MAG: hypothetical protein IK115_08675 [Lachnospiraceae bacterium]|nr:hypothetical protein [Lachnospiraceae bacterium]